LDFDADVFSVDRMNKYTDVVVLKTTSALALRDATGNKPLIKIKYYNQQFSSTAKSAIKVAGLNYAASLWDDNDPEQRKIALANAERLLEDY